MAGSWNRTFDQIKAIIMVVLIGLGATIIGVGLIMYQIDLYDKCYNHNRAWACAKLYGR